MNISKKIRLALMGIALIAVILLSALCFIGFLNIRSTFTRENAAAIDSLHAENVKVMTENSAEMAVSISNVISQSLNVDFSRIMGELATLKGDLEALYDKGGTGEPAEIRRHKEYIISQAAGLTDEEVADTIKVFGVATSMFDNVLRIEPYISLAYIVLENGIVISSTETFYPEVEKADMRTRDWYSGTIAADGLHWSDLYSGTDGRKYVTCSIPLKSGGGELLGVLAFDLRVSEISDKIFISENNSYISAFILNREGHILLSSIGVDHTLQNESIKRSVERLDLNLKKNNYDLGSDIIIGYSVVESTDWIMAAVLDYEQLMRPVGIVSESVIATGNKLEEVIQNTFSETLFSFLIVIAVLLAVILIISYFTGKSIVRPIQVLTKGASIIGKGDLDYVLPDLGSDEIGQLAVSFTNMTKQLNVYIEQVAKSAAEQQQLESELDLARNIQLGMLPDVISCPGYDITGMMVPAKEVGGDFYDFFTLGDNEETLCLVVADVSGKGVGAALFMSMAKVIIKTAAMQGNLSLPEIMEVANTMLSSDNPAELFVTTFCAMIDRASGKIRYANAGHNPPMIIHKDNTAAFLPVKPFLPLAIMEGIKYQEQEAVLLPGETLLLYTDGVTEATNAGQELYGDRRLLDFCRDLRGIDSKETVSRIKADVDAFVKEAPQFDDITIVSVLRNL